MLIPEWDTPEALFGWMVARGVLTGRQAIEAIAAVRHDLAGDASSDAGPIAGHELRDEVAMALALADLAQLDAGRARR